MTPVVTELDVDQLRRRRRQRGLAKAILAAAAVVGITGLVGMTAGGGVVTVERDAVAQDARDAAEPTRALCQSSAPLGSALAAAGLCKQADKVLASPVVAEESTPLAPAELDAIVARVIATPGPPTVPGILSQLAADPQTDALDEAATRAVVAAGVGSVPAAPPAAVPEPVEPAPGAEVPPAEPGAEPGTEPPPAAEPGGDTPAPGPEPSPEPAPEPERVKDLTFETVDGECVGVTTFVAADGTERQERSPAPRGACGLPPAEQEPGAGDPPATGETPEPQTPPASTTPAATPLPGPSADAPLVDVQIGTG